MTAFSATSTLGTSARPPGLVPFFDSVNESVQAIDGVKADLRCLLTDGVVAEDVVNLLTKFVMSDGAIVDDDLTVGSLTRMVEAVAAADDARAALLARLDEAVTSTDLVFLIEDLFLSLCRQTHVSPRNRTTIVKWRSRTTTPKCS